MKICFGDIKNVEKVNSEEDSAELRPKICLVRESENFLFAIYTCSDDSNFCKKRSFDLKNLLLSKIYE